MRTQVARCVWLLVASLICLSASPRFAAGQTRFEWSVAGANVSHYTTVEECLAAVQRIRDSVERKQAIWRDTVPWADQEVVAPPDPVAIAAARRCAQQFSPDRTYRDWSLYVQVLLLANRDQDVATLTTTHLASLKHADTATLRRMERGAKDTLLSAYLQAVPVRMTAAWPMIEELLADPETNVWKRGGLLWAVFNYARAIGDTARARWVSEQFDRVAARLSQSDMEQTKSIHTFRFQHARVLGYATRRAQLDSLRRGTSAYVALRRKNWTRSGNDRAGVKLLIGQHAPALAHNFWFPEGRGSQSGKTTTHATGPQVDTTESAKTQTTTLVRPVQGHPNLLVFLTRACLERSPADRSDTISHGGQPCWETYAALRRLAARYPALKITIVSRTYGHFWPLVPDPTTEANLLHRWLTEFHRLPASLVVTTTEFWKLPEPDLRRINETTRYETDYGGGGMKDKFAVLVDQDGIIVEAQELGRRSEPEWTELLDIVTRR